MDIQYIGENLWPKNIGHAFIVLSFVSGLLATIAYFFANQWRETTDFRQWRNIGRGAFAVHGFSIIAVVSIIFYVMIRQHYEYQYVWAHVSDELPMKYIFSAFWEGQEGSFLLWLFWHIVLGGVLIGTARQWESPVMAVLSAIQVFIVSMILGVYLGFGEDAVKIGSNPLLLLRETMDAPIFSQADYLELIKGNGLNPLLQNYWMTIHPPTLFLGFASTSIPFAFAIAGLWRRDHKAWLRPALPWALFSGAILGTGILMGGAWAYEALSFGGYWAWDPVENMSLVPWLILLAGIHTNLIARNTGYSIRSTYIFYLLSFLFIVYSTFLTRSGVLGETSVHAFTEMGLEWQLILFIGAFLLLSVVMLALRYKGIPAPEKEESISSREFWMFIGTLVLLFSGLIITASTSLPVYNKIMQFFDPSFEGRVITDPVPHYNKFQIWIGVFVALLSGISQFLRYREPSWARHARRFGIHLGISAVLGLVLTLVAKDWIQGFSWQYSALMYSGMFAIVANIDYLISFVRGNLKASGSAVAHLGFGIMIVGIIASGLNKTYISSNPFVMDGLIEGASEESLKNNILLFKGQPMVMDDYEVTYVKDTLVDFTRTFTVNYKRRNESGQVVEEFNLEPNVLYEKTFQKIAASNPATKRYWNKDVFTHIASLAQVEMNLELRRQREDSLNYKPLALEPEQWTSLIDTVRIVDKDTFTIRRYEFRLLSVNRRPTHPDYVPEAGDLALGAKIALRREDDDRSFTAEPVIVLRGQFLYQYPAQINDLSTRIRLSEQAFESFFVPEDQLDYKPFSLRQGEEITFEGLKVRFSGFNKQPAHSAYKAEAGDIAVGASFDIQMPNGKSSSAEPVFFIRDNRPFNIKDEAPEAGLHLRFQKIDPKTESIEVLLAKAEPRNQSLPIEIATDALRSDYIVLEAMVFPGINLFWIGSTLMMVGLTLAMIHRMNKRRRSPEPDAELA